MTEPSRIRTVIDFDKRGKQVSFLAVPSSTNTSAYGTVTIIGQDLDLSRHGLR